MWLGRREKRGEEGEKRREKRGRERKDGITKCGGREVRWIIETSLQVLLSYRTNMSKKYRVSSQAE